MSSEEASCSVGGEFRRGQHAVSGGEVVKAGCPLLRKHLLKNLKHLAPGRPVDCTQISDESFPVNGADLIQDDLSPFIFKRTGYSGRVITPYGGQGGHYDGLNMAVHFVR